MPKPLFIAFMTIPIIVMIVGALGFVPPVQDRLFRVFSERLLAQAGISPFEGKEGMHLLLCGTGSPLPDPNRAATCTVVAAGKRIFLFDAGGGSGANIRSMLGRKGQPDTIFLTHFHSDHISDLGDAALTSWANGRAEPLTVYGPPGVERVVRGFNESYALDSSYRIAHHGEETMAPSGQSMTPRPIVIAEGEQDVIALQEDGVTITAFLVNHDPAEPAYGYRIDYRGRSVILSGDTSKHPNVARVGKGADIMLHDALQPEMVATLEEVAKRSGGVRIEKILHDIPEYHASPIEAAESANEAGAGLLIYHHLVPPITNVIAKRMFLRGVSAIRSDDVIIGEDGFHFYLPPESDEIEKLADRP